MTGQDRTAVPRIAKATRRWVLLVAVLLAPLAAAQDVTTVGDGTNPADLTVGPGTAATALDAFTLQTSAGTDAVSSVTVTLAAGTWVGLSAVSVQDAADCTQGPPLGSVAPSSDVVTVPLTGVVATTTLAAYHVCVTPRTHAAMPARPGASYAVTGTVTSIASSGSPAYADAASATITVDNASPGNVAWGAIQPSSGQISLAWTGPADADFADAVVLRSAGAPVTDAPAEGASPAAGTDLTPSAHVACVQAAGPCVDAGLAANVAYYYRAFARDSRGNYAAGVAAGPAYAGTNPLPVGDTMAGSTKVSVAIVNPANGSVVSGGAQEFRVQVRVFSPGATIGAVEVTTDAGGSWTPAPRVSAYGTATTLGVFEARLSLAAADGGARYTIVARGHNSAASCDPACAWINSAPVEIVVKPARTGDGRLLVRDNSSQLCTDCHAIASHGSETLGTAKGAWATVCRDCHTPHGTTNIYLVPTQITPPPRGGDVPSARDVVFLSPTTMVDTVGPTYRGVCQVCHQNTTVYKADGTGAAHKGGDLNCTATGCHKHGPGPGNGL